MVDQEMQRLNPQSFTDPVVGSNRCVGRPVVLSECFSHQLVKEFLRS
jgi:hypothetical protein